MHQHWAMNMLGLRAAESLCRGHSRQPIVKIPLKSNNLIKGKVMPNKEDKISYALVELVGKDADKAAEPESGLFRGLRIRGDKKNLSRLVLMCELLDKTCNKDSIIALNLDAFNILSTVINRGDRTETTIFLTIEKDQEKAFEILQDATAELADDGRMVANDPEIVDIDTYKNIPLRLLAKAIKADNNKDKGANDDDDDDDYNVNPMYNGGHYTGNNTNWQKKQAVKAAAEKIEKDRQEKMRWTPTLIKRKGDKPSTKELNLMKKKVLSVVKGDYKAELPDVKEDDIEDDDYNGCGM